MNPYVLGVDVWEGALDVNEEIMLRAGVKFMIIRINDMDGGLHHDKNFTNQWAQAKNFIRWPYFVYTPWADQRVNFNYLCNIMPPEATHVSLDIEVVRQGYNRQEYARQVSGFVNMCATQWSVDIYTGAWFLPYLSSWPAHVHYWFARYPYEFYPKGRVHISWEELHQRIQKIEWNVGQPPGPCRMWQISGDRLILPGTAERPMDINLFNGTLSELEAYAGMKFPGGAEPLPIVPVVPERGSNGGGVSGPARPGREPAQSR